MVVAARRLFLLIYSRQFAISSTPSSPFRAIKLFDRTSWDTTRMDGQNYFQTFEQHHYLAYIKSSYLQGKYASPVLFIFGENCLALPLLSHFCERRRRSIRKRGMMGSPPPFFFSRRMTTVYGAGDSNALEACDEDTEETDRLAT